MPSLRRMDDEEVQSLEATVTLVASERLAVAREYDGYLEEYEPGEYVEVTLEEDENKQNVRNRLQSAAKRRGWTLNFKRTKGQALRFKVEIESRDDATEVSGRVHEELEAVA